MTASTLFYFLLTSALLTLAPGPDSMYLLAKSLADGAKSGVALAGGLASGTLFHTALVILGAAALLQNSPLAFAALRYAGALYLLYLAWSAFHETGDLRLGGAGKAAPPAALYRRGLLMNILNPKVLLFFLAFLPQFVSADAGRVGEQLALLGLLFGAQAFLLFSALALCADRLRRVLTRVPNLARTLGLAQGAVLLVIAALLIVE